MVQTLLTGRAGFGDQRKRPTVRSLEGSSPTGWHRCADPAPWRSVERQAHLHVLRPRASAGVRRRGPLQMAASAPACRLLLLRAAAGGYFPRLVTQKRRCHPKSTAWSPACPRGNTPQNHCSRPGPAVWCTMPQRIVGPTLRRGSLSTAVLLVMFVVFGRTAGTQQLSGDSAEVIHPFALLTASLRAKLADATRSTFAKLCLWPPHQPDQHSERYRTRALSRPGWLPPSLATAFSNCCCFAMSSSLS